MISLQVLQAFLSNDASQRQAAEAHFQNMDVNARVLEWPAVYQQAISGNDTNRNNNNNINNNTAMLHMIAVLWRRDILQCGGGGGGANNSSLVTLMDPLLQIFAASALDDDKIRAAFGHCLAEVVALTESSAALEQALKPTEALIKTHPGPVLELYQSLAQAVSPRQWTPSVTAWVLDRLQGIPVPSQQQQQPQAAAGFCTAATLRQSNHQTMLVVDTLSAISIYCGTLELGQRVEHILHAWLVATTDPDTLAHILQSSANLVHNSNHNKNDTNNTGVTLSSHFWQAAWQQVQPHANAEPRLVCQTLQGLVDNMTTKTTTTTTLTLTHAQSLEAVQMLIHILEHAPDDDTEDWTAVEWLEEDSFETDHDEEGLASFALDVLQQWLAAGTAASQDRGFLPAVLQAVQSPRTDSWRSLWATLTVWQACLSAVPVALEPFAATLLSGLSQVTVTSSSSTQHVRVRHQAWQTLAGFVQTYPEQVHDKNGLAAAIQQGLLDGHPRVTAVVCRVLTSMAIVGDAGNTDNDNDEDGPNYVWNTSQLDTLLQGLAEGPLSNKASCRLVVVRGLRAVAALARSGPLAQFYAPTMALLLGWSEREVSIMGDALEAASLVAQSLVQDETVADRVRLDAQALVQRILHVLQVHGGSTDREPLLSACARLAYVMEDDFAPFLPTVLQLLLAKVTAKDEIEFGAGDTDGLDQTRRRDWQDDSLTVAVPGRGLTKVTLHTSQIEEKAQAIRALYELASAMPSGWAPYFDMTWEALEPLLEYAYHADIRTTAAQSMAALVGAGFASEHDHVWQGFPRAALAVAKQLVNEANTEQEDLFALADSLSEILYSAFSRKGTHNLILQQSYASETATEVVKYCGQALEKCLRRRAALTVQIGNSNSSDKQASYTQQLDEEQKLLTPLVDSIGYSLKILGPTFAPIFEQNVAPLLGPFLSPNADTRARWSAVCLFDDCVEHCGPQAAARFAPQLLSCAMLGMQDATDQDLVQASIYGIAQIARYAPVSVLAPYADTIIPTLVSIASKRKESAASQAIHENSVSALASLVLFRSAPFPGKHIKPEVAGKILLENMPLTCDYDEAKICSTQLCELIESSLIPFTSNTQELIRVIGETLALVAEEEEVATDSACERMTEILMHLQREASSSDLQQGFSCLSPESQNAVQVAMERHAFAHNNVVTP